MARLLIMCGANSSAQDSLGDTPLICAARSGSLPIATMLINAGACVSAQNQVSFYVLIIFFCFYVSQ